MASNKKTTLTRTKRRLLNAGASIQLDPVQLQELDYLHSIFCQVSFPRRRTEARTLERTSGRAKLLLEAGHLMIGREWKEQPLPYGPLPRLLVIHFCSEVTRTGSRVIDTGASMRELLRQLGISESGGSRGGLTSFVRQMKALTATKVNLGFIYDDFSRTEMLMMVQRFDAWNDYDDTHLTSWPKELELTMQFADTIAEHAVPLDSRALQALKHSALDLDIYCWLAQRLHRITSPSGLFLSWQNLMDQFGPEYKEIKDFRKSFLAALEQVRRVYPQARLEQVRGGLRFRHSPPPVPKIQVVVDAAAPGKLFVPFKDRTDL